MAMQMLMLGVLADLLRSNRVIGERVLQRVRNIELTIAPHTNPDTELLNEN